MKKILKRIRCFFTGHKIEYNITETKRWCTKCDLKEVKDYIDNREPSPFYTCTGTSWYKEKKEN